MRPEKRIRNFLKILGNEWIKQGVDLRFTQFLFNNRLENTNAMYHLEEHELLNIMFPDIDPSEYMYWGTYGIDGKSKRKYILIKDMETDHIQNVLANVPTLSTRYRTLFENELKKRKHGQNT